MGDSKKAAHDALAMVDRVLKASGQVIWTAKDDGTILDGRGAVEEVFGAPASEVAGRSMVEMIAPEELERTTAALSALISTGEPARGFETTMLRHDGTRLEVRAGGVMTGTDGEGDRIIVGVAADVSEEKRAKRELEVERRRFFDAFRLAPMGILLVHLHPKDGVFVWRANDEACLIAGAPREQVEDTWMRENGLLDLSSGERNETYQSIEKLLAGEIRKFTMDRSMVTPKGERRIVRAHVGLLEPDHWKTGSDGRPVNGTIHIEDVTMQVEAREKLQYLASHDPLTGLWNRQFFTDSLERHQTGKRRGDAEGALIVLDLDNFKEVNDSWGHHAGDGVLQAVAEMIRSHLREDDRVARLGGDEFAVLLPGVSTETADRIASQLKESFTGAEIPVLGAPDAVYAPKASVGVLMLSSEGGGADRVLRLCDSLMYEAKEGGGDSHVLRLVGELKP